jgi:putative DNA primase/helicase
MIPASIEQWQTFYSSHLKRFKRTNDRQAESLCPFHEDKDPSLSINLETSQCKCHGCDFEGNGLTFADRLGIPRVQVPGWVTQLTSPSKIVATYDYRDENGVLLFQAIRFEPKDFRQRRPDGVGGWIWDLDGTRRVLYRLPELLDAIKDTVFVVEGEKDVETMRSLGFTATCNPMGAGKWRDEYSETLKGFLEVIIIADKDKKGREHAQQVARSVSKVVGRVKVMEMREIG